MNASEFSARLDHLDETTQDTRVAPTMPPPRGEFFSRAELERRVREYEAEAGRALARAESIKSVIKGMWGDE